MAKRFWAYSHNDDGDLMANLGEFDTFAEALDGVATALQDEAEADDLDRSQGPDALDTFRIVDAEADSSTVWLAVPMKRMRAEAKANTEWYVDHDIHLGGGATFGD